MKWENEKALLAYVKRYSSGMTDEIEDKAQDVIIRAAGRFNSPSKP